MSGYKDNEGRQLGVGRQSSTQQGGDKKRGHSKWRGDQGIVFFRAALPRLNGGKEKGVPKKKKGQNGGLRESSGGVSAAPAKFNIKIKSRKSKADKLQRRIRGQEV